jgi:hypothetical protein
MVDNPQVEHTILLGLPKGPADGKHKTGIGSPNAHPMIFPWRHQATSRNQQHTQLLDIKALAGSPSSVGLLGLPANEGSRRLKASACRGTKMNLPSKSVYDDGDPLVNDAYSVSHANDD